MRYFLAPHVLGLALVLPVGLTRASPLSVGEEAAARKLYLNKCAKCHKFYNPAQYSDAQWQMWMSKMSKKAKLTPEQEQLLSRYLEKQRQGTAGH